jgi:hypothetical protein
MHNRSTKHELRRYYIELQQRGQVPAMVTPTDRALSGYDPTQFLKPR